LAFTKAEAKQARLKLGIYGGQGSGKTFTALLIAEGLAKLEGKRIAYIDTEMGTDFYAQAIPERSVHPEAFDFDRIVTRSIMEVVEEVRNLDPSVHGVLVADSMTHLWEATTGAYTGPRMKNGQIPVQAWGPIKKPYKQFMSLFLDGNFHAILCGREGIKMEANDDGEMEFAGSKMKAEGETGYEPHILIRMKAEWKGDGKYANTAFFEKDRSGMFTGRKIESPNFQTIVPLLRYLGSGVQGKIGDLEQSAERDAAAIEAEQERTTAERTATFETIRAAVVGARDMDELRAAWGLVKGKKGKLGDLWETLETAKEARKVELMKAGV
jgi:hypothetical protein